MILTDLGPKKIPCGKSFFILQVKDDVLTVHENKPLKPRKHVRIGIYSLDYIGIKDVFKHGGVGWRMSDLLYDSLTFAGLSPSGLKNIRVENIQEGSYFTIFKETPSDTEGLAATTLVKMVGYLAARASKTMTVSYGEFWPEFTATLT
jgi:hypothetical protein